MLSVSPAGLFCEFFSGGWKIIDIPGLSENYENTKFGIHICTEHISDGFFYCCLEKWPLPKARLRLKCEEKYHAFSLSIKH